MAELESENEELAAKVTAYMDAYEKEHRDAFGPNGPHYWHPWMAPPIPEEVDAWFVKIEEKAEKAARQA